MSLSLKYVGFNALKKSASIDTLLNPFKCKFIGVAVTKTAGSNGNRRIHILFHTLRRLVLHENKINVPAVIPQRQQSCKSNSNNLFRRLFSSEKENLNFFNRYKPIMDVPPGLFKGLGDRFNGVTIDSESEYNGSDNFTEKLKKSLDFWIKNKRRGIWFKVRTEHSIWVPDLTKNGFEFHHADKGFVVLFRWLPTDEYLNIPDYAHTMLGVGAVVVNDKNEILVVNERYGLIPNSWKLPGGYVDPKEDFVDAAIREVREETGIESEFKTMLCLRHTHNGSFGCSDLYVVVALKPTSLNLKRDTREIAKLKWMPVQEYLNNPNVHETNRHFVKCLLDYQKLGIRFTCEKGVHQILKKTYHLYYMKPTEKIPNKN